MNKVWEDRFTMYLYGYF